MGDVGTLMNEAERFRTLLPKSGCVLVISDNDTDGIVAAHLFARYFKKRNPYTSLLVVPTEREYVRNVIEEHPNCHVVMLDLSPRKGMEDILEKRRVYVIDHHPTMLQHPNAIIFSPHIFNIPNASRYNTGFLVYILFKDDIDKHGDLWKVAVSSFGDSSYDYLKQYYHGLDVKMVETASHMIGSVPQEKVGLAFTALEESKSIEEFVKNKELLKMKEEYERTLMDILNNIETYTIYSSPHLVVALLPEHRVNYKSAVSTVYSKHHPDVLVAVGIEEGDKYNFSLRFQNAEERGVHLGVFSSQIAERWGTKGGGHAPAAGVKIPKDKLEEFVEELKKITE